MINKFQYIVPTELLRFCYLIIYQYNAAKGAIYISPFRGGILVEIANIRNIKSPIRGDILTF